MFGIIPFQFRFRGKVRRILDIYFCFLDEGNVALHPTQIARRTGISFAEVARRLEAPPELFVKLPKREGITRYRITTTASTRTPQETEALLAKYAQRESTLLYAFGTMVLAMLIIVVLTIAPNVFFTAEPFNENGEKVSNTLGWHTSEATGTPPGPRCHTPVQQL